VSTIDAETEDARQAILRDAFLRAFSKAWQTLALQDPARILSDYEGCSSWTGFLFGPNPYRSTEGSLSGYLFPRTSELLKQIAGVKIDAVRHEDEKIDMSFVGGEQCFGPARGWGYASRQLVLIEHENLPARAREEFYKLIFRVADLKVLAFPDELGGFEQNSAGTKALHDFNVLSQQVGAGQQVKNIIVMMAKRADSTALPSWRWSEFPNFEDLHSLSEPE
jgi:hypothetical protein